MTIDTPREPPAYFSASLSGHQLPQYLRPSRAVFRPYRHRPLSSSRSNCLSWHDWQSRLPFAALLPHCRMHCIIYPPLELNAPTPTKSSLQWGRRRKAAQLLRRPLRTANANLCPWLPYARGHVPRVPNEGKTGNKNRDRFLRPARGLPSRVR